MASAAPNSNAVLMDFFQQLLSSNQPPNHALVPVESLTGSPSSSTGSGSILDWNSNSDGELLDSDLDFLPPSIEPHSPMKCSLPTPPASGTSLGSTPSTTASAPPSTSSHGSQPDSDSDSWTSLFGGLMPPAPIGGLDSSATSTVPESGDGAMPTASNVFSSRQMSDLDKMCDQFESRVWVGDYPTFAPRKLVVDDQEKDNGDLSSTTEPELEISASGAEGDMSLANTIVPTQLVGAPSLEAPTTSTPTAAISTLTAPSPQNPWISSGLFQALDEVSPVSSNPQGMTAEIISIAEYFHRKALSAEESPANRATPTPEASTQAEAPIRPDSANSGLSYFTGPRSAPSSPPPAISATLATDDVDAAGNSNNNPIFTEDEGSAPTTVLGSLAIPPIVEAKNDDVALSSSTPSEEPSAFQREVTETINLSREAFLQNFLNRSNSYPAAPRREPIPTTVDPANLSASTQSAFQRLLDSSLTRSPPRRDSPGLFGPRTPRSSSPQQSEDLEEEGSLTRSPGPGKKPDFPSQGRLWSQVSLPSTSSSPQRPIQFLIRQSSRSRSRSRSPHLRRQRMPMPPPFLPSGMFGPRTPSPPSTPKRGRKQMADLHRGAQVAAANADANTNVNVRAGARTPSPYSSTRSSSPRRCVSYLDYEDSRASSPREEHQQESRKGYNPFLRTRTEILPSPSSYVSLPQTPPSPAIRRICISRSRIPSPSYSAANEIAGGDSYSPSPPPLLPHPPQPIVIVIPETDRTRSPSYANSDDGATPEPISPEYVPNKTLSPRYIVQNETDENDDDDDVDDDDGRRSDASRGLVDAPIPNIPRWLTDWSKSAVKDSRSIHAPPKRSRPPLPPVPTKVDNNGDGGAWQNGDSVPLFQPYPSQPQPQPQRAPAPLAPQNRIQAQARAQDQTQTGASKAEGTPQFALRSDSMAHMSRNDYYASAFPSSWPTIPPYASPPPAPSTTTSTLESPVHATAIRVPVNNSNNNGFGMQTSQFHQPANVQRMSHFFNTPNCGQSTARSGSVSGSNRDIPNSYGSGPMPNPLYTSSTLPKDRTSAFLPPPSWSELAPPQRRLRFAPLPPTPGSDTRRGSGPPPVIPHFHNPIYCPPPPPPMPPQPSNYTGVGVGNMNMYTYQAPTPRPVVPPVVIPIPPAPSFSTPSVTGAPRVQHSTLNMNLFGTNSYPASKKYCFADATVVFRVENCLYKVHRHFFELHSPHLRQLLRPYYFSFNNHIFLSDVKKVEFERLLSIFYPSDLTKPDINTVSGWTSMLELSSKWSMAQIKALAIQKLIPLTTAVEKIALAKKHNLSSADPEHAEWLVPAYTELCARRSPLTLEEAEDMDLPTIIKVWEVQNAIVGLDCMYSNYGEKVTELVKEKFGFRGAAGMPGTTISGFWSSCS